jgi:hypothetical protein
MPKNDNGCFNFAYCPHISFSISTSFFHNRKDGTSRDSFVLQPAEEWPEVVIFAVADAQRTFVRDKGRKYREASHVMAPMPYAVGF